MNARILLISLCVTILITSVSSQTTTTIPIRCGEWCSKSRGGITCLCGTNTCAADQYCGYDGTTQTKRCFNRTQVEDGECLTRGHIVVARILCIVLLATPPVVLAMLALGAVIFLINADNPEQRKSGKSMMFNAIVGAICVFGLISAAGIVNIHVDYTICMESGEPSPTTTTLPPGPTISTTTITSTTVIPTTTTSTSTTSTTTTSTTISTTTTTSTTSTTSTSTTSSTTTTSTTTTTTLIPTPCAMIADACCMDPTVCTGMGYRVVASGTGCLPGEVCCQRWVCCHYCPVPDPPGCGCTVNQWGCQFRDNCLADCGFVIYPGGSVCGPCPWEYWPCP